MLSLDLILEEEVKGADMDPVILEEEMIAFLSSVVTRETDEIPVGYPNAQNPRCSVPRDLLDGTAVMLELETTEESSST